MKNMKQNVMSVDDVEVSFIDFHPTNFYIYIL